MQSVKEYDGEEVTWPTSSTDPSEQCHARIATQAIRLDGDMDTKAESRYICIRLAGADGAKVSSIHNHDTIPTGTSVA